MGYPKGQLKSADSGEGPRGKMGGKTPSSGKRDAQLSTGREHDCDAKHTASWQTGAKLKVKSY